MVLRRANIEIEKARLDRKVFAEINHSPQNSDLQMLRQSKSHQNQVCRCWMGQSFTAKSSLQMLNFSQYDDSVITDLPLKLWFSVAVPAKIPSRMGFPKKLWHLCRTTRTFCYESFQDPQRTNNSSRGKMCTSIELPFSAPNSESSIELKHDQKAFHLRPITDLKVWFVLSFAHLHRVQFATGHCTTLMQQRTLA